MSADADADSGRNDAEKVEAWRLQSLWEAGYPRPLAEKLAVRRDVDLHDAVELVEKVRKKGKSPKLAAQILL